MAYRPPFVSERLGEVAYNGCTFRSSLMARAAGDFGESLQNADHEPRDAKAIHAYAEALEPGPPTQKQGFNPFDVQQSIDKIDKSAWDMPSWDNPRTRVRIDFPEWKKRIIAGECGVLQGNPVNCSSGSKLRKYVPGDVGHAIYVNDGDANGGYIFDPMGLPVGSYDGDKVPWADLQDFASEYSKPNGFVFCSLIERGSMTAAAITGRQLAKTTKDLKAADNAATTAKVAMTAAIAAQKAAELALGTCPADLLAAQADGDLLQEQLSRATDSVTDLTTQLATATSYGEAQARIASAANAGLVTATARVKELESGAALTAANAKVAELQKQLDAAGPPLSFIGWLRKALGRLP